MPNFASKDRTIMNNKLNIKIEQLKNINNIELNLPIETGLYAITGANGTGKSTIMTVISKVVRNSAFNVFNLMIIHLIVKSQYPMMEKKILGQKPVEDGVVVQLI